MTQNHTEHLNNDIMNRRKAYTAMCFVTLLLIGFSLISTGLSYLVQNLMNTNSSLLERYITRFIILFGIGKTTAVSAARQLILSGAFAEYVNMLFSVITTLIPAMLFSKAVHLKHDECFPVKGKYVSGLLFIYGALQIFAMVAGVLSTSLYDMFFPDSAVHPGGFTDFSGIEFNIYTLIIRILSVCVYVPLVEEYIFRGVIFGYLRRFGTMFAVFAGGAIFGIAHNNPSQSVYALVFGIFSSFLVVVTGNIKTSIIFHALNNLSGILGEQIVAYLSKETADIINCSVNFITIFLGFTGIYIIAKKDGLCSKFYEICKHESPQRTIHAGIREILVFPFILYCIIYALRVISMAV